MNAKKIMGAVLVALLAAALFVGAGAAQTVFVNENVTTTEKTGLEGTWSNGDAYVVIGSNGIVVPGPTFVPGTYKNGEETLFVTNPTAVISGVVGTGYEAYPFVGANIYQNTLAEKIHFSVESASDNVTIDGLYVTFPDGTNQLFENQQDLVYEFAGKNATLGVYKVQALFNYTNFTAGILLDKLLSDAVTVTVVEEGTATISAAADTYLKSEAIKLVITGQPGKVYNVSFDTAYLFNATENQLIATEKVDGKLQFVMPNTGKVDLSIKANATAAEAVESTEKITLEWTADNKPMQKSVTIAFGKGTITAKTEEASYFIGDKVTVSGTSTAGKLAYYYINGTNFEMPVQTFGSTVSNPTTSGDDFEFIIDTQTLVSNLNKKIDVGSYTVTLVTEDKAKATVVLVLKQPFISIISSPEVIVQGEDAEFIINAEATNNITAYIFGTNFFINQSKVETNVMGENGEEIENQFKIALVDTVTKNMSAGQYFAVFQHPMYDQVFNILPFDQAVYLNTQGEAASGAGKLFDVDLRQTANAAQALCDALDSQNIDDMYVKASFFVVGEDESFTLSAIPTTIAQGETLVISGVSTANAEEYVTVEMISTAFAAVPKETVGSAAFIAVTTQIAEDGTWEVTLDTSDLNVDEYSLKVACSGEDKPWKNVNINVVEGADTPDTPDTPDVPDTPDTPDTPTEPATPGFGALAALAGLGAVAVLLLRRE